MATAETILWCYGVTDLLPYQVKRQGEEQNMDRPLFCLFPFLRSLLWPYDIFPGDQLRLGVVKALDRPIFDSRGN
jgi:hypothetical protein